MLISKKSQYALQAVLELALHAGAGPLKIADIAKSQSIPVRFLEVILNQLKQAGLVVSRRGVRGGYSLGRAPQELTVSHVIECIQGPITLADGVGNISIVDDGTINGENVLVAFWQKAEATITQLVRQTTFRDLVEQHNRLSQDYVASYSI